MMVTGCWDGTVKVWEMRGSHINPKPTNEWFDHESPVLCISLSEDGKYVAAGAEDGKVIVWETSTGQEVFNYQVSKGGR